MILTRPLALCAIVVLAGCASSAPERPDMGPAAAPLAAPGPVATPTAAAAGLSPAARGLAFAADQCSGCHAVQPGEPSPNPQSPTFVAVANELGFTPETLREFFVDGHDTPDAMTIKLEEEQADMVTAYIMSLRKPG